MLGTPGLRTDKGTQVEPAASTRLAWQPKSLAVLLNLWHCSALPLVFRVALGHDSLIVDPYGSMPEFIDKVLLVDPTRWFSVPSPRRAFSTQWSLNFQEGLAGALQAQQAVVGLPRDALQRGQIQHDRRESLAKLSDCSPGFPELSWVRMVMGARRLVTAELAFHNDHPL